MGVFQELPSDPHVSSRNGILAGTRICVQADLTPTFLCHADSIPIGDVLRAVQEVGVARLDLDCLLDTRAFMRLSERFGDPIPLRATHLQSFVEHSIVLNIRHTRTETTDPFQKPFSLDPVPLHTEESRTPPTRQPRLLIFLCVEPSADPTGGRTIIAPFENVGAALSDDDLHVLRHLRYEDYPAAPCFLRGGRNEPLFAFRDFDGTPLRWQAAPSVNLGSNARINKVIGRLLVSMYNSVNFGVVWKLGTVLFLNNTRVFHGRTQDRGSPSVLGRHLKRIRLV